MKQSLITLLLSFLFVSTLQAKPISVIAWNYYLAPPFVTSPESGLAQDLVNVLNIELKGKYKIELWSLPRAQLNRVLNNEKSGITLFVNWAWMGKGARDKYLWSSPILEDRNEIISSVNDKVDYEGPESLKGLIFGAVRGRKYKSLEAYFVDQEIERYDVTIEQQVLAMLLKGRVNVTSQPRSLVLALSKEMSISDKLYFSPKPLFSFTRHIMLTPDLHELHSLLEEIVNNLDTNELWNSILKEYSLGK